MGLGSKPGPLKTAKQNSATAIVRGNLCIYNDTADGQNVVRSTALAAKPAGVCFEDSPGQSTAAVPKTFPMATTGDVKVKAGGTCTQGLYCASDASGLGVNAATGAIRAVYGRFLESGVAGDLVMVELRIGEYWV